MATGSLITTLGRNLALHRLYTASPTDTAPTQFQSGTGTTTPALADTDLDTGIGSKTNFVSGYPSFDTTNVQVTTRGFIDSTTLNGNNISEAGEFNTDGTPELFSRAVFTAISKSASVEIAFIWKHRIRSP